MSNRARDGFRRIVVFQPRTGWVADMVSGQYQPPSFDENEQYFETGQGRKAPVSRSRRMTIPVVDINVAAQLRVMAREGCEVQAIGVGFNLHTVWLSSSAINFVPFRTRAGSTGGGNLILENSLFETGIWHDRNILAGIPWACETGTADGADYFFPGPDGYDGPRWEVFSTGAGTTGSGTLTKSGGDPFVDIYLPLAGAIIQNFGTWAGSVVQRDWSGATLSTNTHASAAIGTTDIVEAGCWTIRVTVTSASQIPDVRISSPGAATLRTGGCINCSNQSATLGTIPSWTT